MKQLKRFTSVLCSLLCVFTAFTSCGEEDLPSPTGVNIDIAYQLYWEPVDGARKYTVEIKNLATGEVQSFGAYSTTYSISGYAEGEYEVRVKALSGANSDRDSAWSETFTFYKDYETGCIYTLVNNSEYELSRAGIAQGTVVIEDVYRGKPVTSIGDQAFQSNRNITNIVIGANVKSIGTKAFYNCVNLESVTIPESVTSIGSYAFQACRAIKKLELPEGLETIEEGTFSYCRGLEELKLNEGLKTLGTDAFSNCSGLINVTIPDSVETIEDYAFSEDTALQSVVIGDNVQEIGAGAFFGCSVLEEVVFGEKGNLEIMDEQAFQACVKLSSIELPEGLKTLGANAFYGCAELDEIVLPDSLEEFGEYAFHNTKCYNDQLQAGESYIYLDNWLIACSEETLKTLEVLDGTVLKSDVVGIADQVFLRASALTKVSLPQTVKYIGDYAFYQNEKLWRLETFSSLQKIGDWAFGYCSFLQNVYLGKGLKEIGNYAFYGCTVLQNSTSTTTKLIPDSVEKVGTYAFKKTGLWSKPDENGVIYAGNWVVGYDEDSPPSVVELREDTKGIANYAFYWCDKLKGINANVPEFIGMGAFYGCTSLATIGLNINLTKIEKYTFYKCASLFSVSLPSMLKSIGRSAFYKCEYLNEIDLSACRVEEIDEYAFYGCKNVKKINLGDDLEIIGDYAFYDCSLIKEITIPDSVETLGSRAFSKCASLQSVTIGSGISEIDEYTFNGCVSLKTVYIPENIKAIKKGAFYKCSKLEQVLLANNVESIGDFAFYGAEALQYISFPSTVKSIGKYAFKGALGMESVTLGSHISTIGAHAFYGLKNGTIYTSEKDFGAGWDDNWNSSRRPVVWGCELSEDQQYVVSLTITENTLSNVYQTIKVETGETDEDGNPIMKTEKINALTAPTRLGWIFKGWSLQKDATEGEYGATELVNISVGTKLYAVWAQEADLPAETPTEGDLPQDGETL